MTATRDEGPPRGREADGGGSQRGDQIDQPHFQTNEDAEWLGPESGNECEGGEEATVGRTSGASQRKRPWPDHHRGDARGGADNLGTPLRKPRVTEGCQKEGPCAVAADSSTGAGRPGQPMSLTVPSSEDGSQADGGIHYTSWNRDPRGREPEHVGDEQGRAVDSADNGDRGRREGAGFSAGSGARRAGARRGCSGAMGGAARGGARPRGRSHGA